MTLESSDPREVKEPAGCPRPQEACSTQRGHSGSLVPEPDMRGKEFRVPRAEGGGQPESEVGEMIASGLGLGVDGMGRP